MKSYRFYHHRELSFNLSNHVNEILLPNYDALKDPFLSGYFDNPIIKRNLKETGVIRKKKRFSVPKLNKITDSNPQYSFRNHNHSHLIKSTHVQPQYKLPALEDIITDRQSSEYQRSQIKSSETRRSSRVYRSKKKSEKNESESVNK